MTKTLKVMSIIGIVLASISLICAISFNNLYDYEAAIGWGMYSSLYLLAFGIVGLVQYKRNKK